MSSTDEMHRAVGHSEMRSVSMVTSRGLEELVVEPAVLTRVAALKGVGSIE